MKIHRNLAEGIIRGLELILIQEHALRPTLNKVLKYNKKWGSRDRRTLGKALLDCIRWKRYYEYLGGIKFTDENYLWSLLGVWILTNKQVLPDWQEFKNIENTKLNFNEDRQSLPLQIKSSLPDWLDQLGQKYFKKAVWEQECLSMNTQAPLVLRANLLKGKTDDLLEQLNKDY